MSLCEQMSRKVINESLTGTFSIQDQAQPQFLTEFGLLILYVKNTLTFY